MNIYNAVYQIIKWLMSISFFKKGNQLIFSRLLSVSPGINRAMVSNFPCRFIKESFSPEALFCFP